MSKIDEEINNQEIVFRPKSEKQKKIKNLSKWKSSLLAEARMPAVVKSLFLPHFTRLCNSIIHLNNNLFTGRTIKKYKIHKILQDTPFIRSSCLLMSCALGNSAIPHVGSSLGKLRPNISKK